MINSFFDHIAVLGDAGRLYVAADTIPVYKSLLPYSTVITPNWFEVETLTDVPLTSLASLRKALRILHQEYHVPNVAISSLPLKKWLWNVLPENVKPPATEDGSYLVCISSSSRNADSSISTVYVHAFEQIPGYFTGVGDLFSAILLAHYCPSQEPEPLLGVPQTTLSYAASLAITKTRAVLSLTHEHALKLPEEDRQPSDVEADAADPNRKVRRMRGRELRVIQGQDIIRGVAPVKAERLQPWIDFWSE
jgi:pyridoxine kinase